MKMIKVLILLLIFFISSIQSGNCKIKDELTDKVIMKNDEKKFPGLFKITNRNKKERIYNFDYRIVPPFRKLKNNDLDMENPFLMVEKVKKKKKKKKKHLIPLLLPPKRVKIKINYKKVKISEDIIQPLW